MPRAPFDCFLSHNWGKDVTGRNNHEAVSKINAALKEKGLVTWFDGDQMRGNLVKTMCRGIDQSSVFVAFVTKEYTEKVGSDDQSDSCKIEFNYAIKRRSGMMIGVPMESDMRDTGNWAGPVGGLLCNDLYEANFAFDMEEELTETGQSKFDEQVENLYKHIQSLLKDTDGARNEDTSGDTTPTSATATTVEPVDTSQAASTEISQSVAEQQPREALHHPDMDLPIPKVCPAKLTDELKKSIRVLMVTVKPDAWVAVLRHMKPVSKDGKILKVLPGKKSKNPYMIGIFGKYCIALVQSDKGSRNAQNVVRQAIECVEPVATIMVGAAFGLKPSSQKVGDVFASQRMTTYDQEIILKDRDVKDGLTVEGGANLSPLFMYPHTFDWESENSAVHRGEILSGSKHVENEEFAEKLKKKYSEAVGIEMEGEGVYTACREKGQQWMIVKGIYGFAGQPNERAKADIPFAAAAATSLVLHVLSESVLDGIDGTTG